MMIQIIGRWTADGKEHATTATIDESDGMLTIAQSDGGTRKELILAADENYALYRFLKKQFEG